ncbi:MAG: IPT/TIG domain-containing protein [Chitinophagaceae bacterium]|nr:IPT/TIG domain-containing protein [Chitinophagaceae bacterium]
MMKLQSLTSFIILIALSATVFSACKKNNDVETNVQITGITPDSGRYSTIVTITGTGFSTNASENLVKFNGKDAVVQSATPSQLTVVVPKGAGTGPLSITVGSKSATYPVFNYILTVTVSTLAESATLFAYGLTTDAQGNIYNYGPSGNITKITQEEEASSFAQEMSGFGGFGITADTHLNIYASASDSCYIFKITPEGVVSILAGDGHNGFADGHAGSARFNYPMGITTDSNGNIYVADFGNNRIRKITPAGTVSTLAGGGARGFADGTGSSARFNSPYGIAVDGQGNIYVADRDNNRIRKITSDGVVSC